VEITSEKKNEGGKAAASWFQTACRPIQPREVQVGTLTSAFAPQTISVGGTGSASEVQDPSPANPLAF